MAAPFFSRLLYDPRPGVGAKTTVAQDERAASGQEPARPSVSARTPKKGSPRRVVCASAATLY